MIKRTLWYGCLVLLCCSFGVYALNATKGSKVAPKSKPVTNSVSAATATTPSTTPVVNSASEAKKAAAALSETTPVTVTEDPMLIQAKQALDNFRATGTMSSADKDLILRYGVGDPGYPSDVDRGRTDNGLDNVGGPDAAGYRYKDNVSPDTATYNWIELRGDANATWLPGTTGAGSWSSHDDGFYQTKLPIGFPFPFYGTNRDSFFVTSNGQIEFGAGNAGNYSGCLPNSTAGAAIMGMQHDGHLDYGGITGGAATVGYRNFGTYLVIEYDSVGNCCSAGGSYKWQAILYNNGKIKLQYNQYVYTDSTRGTVGIQGSGTGPYLQYRCNSTTAQALHAGRAIWFYQPAGLLHDYVTTSITSPTAVAYVSTAYNVTAVITNAGQTTESAPVKYRFNNGAVVGPENTAALTQYSAETHTFTTQVTMPATAGTYELLVYTDLPTDLDRTNDTLRLSINVRACYNVAIGPNAVSLTNQTNCGLGDNYNATCLGSYDGGEDIVYQWTVTTPGDYAITMNPYTTTWTGILVSDHCPPDANCIASVTGSAASPRVIACRAFAAGTYYIMVDTWPTPTCVPQFDLTIASCAAARCCYGDVLNPSCRDTTSAACTALGGTWTVGSTCAANPCPIPVLGESCARPFTDLTVPGSVSGTTVGFANDYTYNGNTAPDVVYSYVAATNDSVTLELCGSSFDTYLYVYAGNCTGTPIAFNDDNSQCTSNSLNSKLVCVPQVAGTTYYVVVDGYSSNSGTYVLTSYYCVPCNVVSEAGDIFEPVEPWPVPGTYSETDPDGGCNDLVPVFSSVACGQSVFGKIFLYTDSISGSLYTDTDWYTITLAQPESLTVTGMGEIPVNFLIGTSPCPTSVLTSVSAATPCVNGSFTTECLDAGTYYIIVTASGSVASTEQKDYRFSVVCTPCTPCVVTTPAGAIEEGEACPSGTDEFNGGCNSTTPVFSPIACGQWVHGTSDCAGGLRDTDWYELVNSTMDSVTFTWKIVAEFPVLGFILDGTTGCATVVQLTSGTANPCDTLTLTSGLLGYGTYWFWVGRSDFTNFTCKDYVAQLSCQVIDSPCNKPDSLTVYMAPDGIHTWVHFRAHEIGKYVVYTSTNKNNDGDPRFGDPQFTAHDTITTVAQNTTVTWIDTAATGAYKNYSVLCVDCTPPPPVGRCCYNAGANCANGTAAECATLGGTWVQGLNCTDNPCPPNAGETCVGAGLLTGAFPIIVTGTTVGATQNYSLVGLGATAPTCWPASTYYSETASCFAPDLTYQFVAPTAGTYTFSLCGSTFDTGIILYNYTCPTEPVNPTDYICGDDDNTACGTQSQLDAIPLTAGQHILIVVTGYSGATGNYTLTISQP